VPTYKIAHITERNINVIIFPVNGSFGVRTPAEQDSMINIFRAKAKAAGLQGNVVVVWDGEGGKVNFKAPPNQYDFFQNVTSEFIDANLNKTISW
jgi:hypothetical protein